MLIRVEAPDFTAGLAVDDAGFITAAAPILAWCKNRPLPCVTNYFRLRGWQLVCLPEWTEDP